MEFRLPEGMLLGVASAAAQIEGGAADHQWNDWADKGHIKDGTSPRRADMHREHWREDIDRMKAMGIQVYRLGIEWCRLEPERGRFDEAVVAEYRALLQYILDCGIQPLLTLHHFTNPMWFERMGAFTKPENIPAFLVYVDFAVRAFGDLVSEYITINEPNVFAMLGYNGGDFPPGESSVPRAMRVMSVMAACHIRAYQRIHRIRTEMGQADTKVSFAHHMRVFVPKNPKNPWHRLCSRVVGYMFQGALQQACLFGKFAFPLANVEKLGPGEYADFLALNYYSRSTVSGLKDGVAQEGPHNDLGWEIYPPGLSQCAAELYALVRRPIYITENGTCDNADAFRARYIAEHLEQLASSGLPVARYYHWCFTDNFEWAEGESARFGLVHVDFETQRRATKPSGEFFQSVIECGGVDGPLYRRYIENQRYHEQSQGR